MRLQIGDKFVITVLLQHKDGSFQKRKTWWKIAKFDLPHNLVTMARLTPVQNGNQFIEMVEEHSFSLKFFESGEPFRSYRRRWVIDLFGLNGRSYVGEFVDTLYEVRSVEGNNVNRKV